MNESRHSLAKIRVPELDGLRGIAILLVLIHHYLCGRMPTDTYPVLHWVDVVFRLAWSGVDLFFVLSGFLIGGILLEQRAAKNFFSTFFLRRGCRVLPLYFAWLGLYVLMLQLLPPGQGRGWVDETLAPRYPGWAYVFLVQNFFVAGHEIFGPLWQVPSWSLALEMQFYLLAPLIIRFVPERKLPLMLLVVIALVSFLRLFMYMFYPSIFVYTLLPCRMDALLLGMLCACLLRDDRARRWLENGQVKLHVALALLLGGIAVLNVLPFCSRTSFEMVWFGYSWLGLFYSCLLLITVTASGGVIVVVMRNQILRYLGIIAYGVFLMHLGIAGLIHGWMRGSNLNINGAADALATIAALGVTLLVATMSWRFFEKPIVDWGRSFGYENGMRRAKK